MIDVGTDPELPYSGYQYRLATKRTPLFPPVLQESVYTFDDRFHETYIVILEKYEYDVFILKYHLKNHSDSPKRYQFLTNKFDVGRILATCIRIAWDVLTEYPHASFGFLGVNSIDEGKDNTKRFQLYSRVASDYFSEKNFEHIFNIEKSTYAMLNRKNKENNLLYKVETLFNKYYPLLEDPGVSPPSSVVG